MIGYTLEEQQRAFRHGIHGKFWCPLTDLVLRPQARATVVLWGLWRAGVFRIRLRRRWRFLRAELTPYGRMLAVEPPKPPSVPVTWCKWCGDVPYPHDHRDWWRTKGLAQADKLREADR